TGDIKAADSANTEAIQILEKADQTASEENESRESDSDANRAVAQARRRMLARAYLYQALFVAREGNPMGALEWFNRSEQILTDELAITPDDVQLQRSLAEVHAAIGFHWTGSPAPERGRPYVEQSLQRRLQIVQNGDANEYDEHNLARSHWDMGYAYRLDAAKQSGQVRNDLFDNALSEYEKSLAILNKLVEQHPTSLRFQQTLGEVHASIGTIHFNRNKRGNLSADERRANDLKALEAYKQSLAIRERMVQQNPGVGRLEYILSRGYMQVATQQKLLGDQDDALANYNRTLAIRRRMLEENEGDIRMQTGMATLLSNIGLIHLDRENGATSALSHFQEAEQIQREVVERAPHIPRNRYLLANHLLNIGLAKRYNGEYRASANQILAAKKATPGDPEQMLVIARHQAKLAALAKDADDEAKDEILTDAIQTIRGLLNAETIDLEELSHPDFDFIRSIPAIKELLTSDASDTKR
ncbi:MAG: hypothetical protein KDB27_27265, partial [Planctomycetales bacterium]|nr:hypothetical protein [Planctomycetales bacterium]